MRIRSVILVCVGALVAAGCGSSSAKVASGGSAPTTSRATTTTHGMSHDMTHPSTPRPAQPVPVLTSGWLDASKVDLSGAPGVSAQEQAAAENILRTTITSLQKWGSYDAAIKDGFISIGDNITGEDHVVHWDWINDGHTFDPQRPESLVYKVNFKTGKRKLEAAMYFLDDTFTLDNTPNTYGKLMQFHSHNDLCFVFGASPHLSGIADAQGKCEKGSQHLLNPMAHVWVRPNACGPFAALQGIGGGNTKNGTHDCDHAHGSGHL